MYVTAPESKFFDQMRATFDEEAETSPRLTSRASGGP